MKMKPLIIGLCMFLGFYGTPAKAQVMTEVQALNFGTFAIIDNSAPHTIIISPNNVAAYDPSIVSGIEAERGHYTLTGMPTDVTFTLGVSISNPPTDGGLMLDNQTSVTLGGSEPFLLLNFTVNTANEMVTDSGGNATLYIGATLRTTGSGSIYTDGTYNGTYDITFFY